MLLSHLPRLPRVCHQYPISRWHFHTVRLFHSAMSINKLPTSPCKRCVGRDRNVQKSATRSCAHQTGCKAFKYDTKTFCSSSQSTLSNTSPLFMEHQKCSVKPPQQEALHSVLSKQSFCTTCLPHLGAGEVFSQEAREQMTLGLSKVRIPRSLFKTIKKRAAVLVPLCTVRGEPAILLTLRSTNLSKHTGEVSFPGGIQDDSDADIIQTALREADEELGIKPQDVDVWCKMAGLPNKKTTIHEVHILQLCMAGLPPSLNTMVSCPEQNLSRTWQGGNTSVVPVVGFVGEIDVDKLRLNPNEVECAFTIPLHKLLDPINQRHTRFVPKLPDQSKHHGVRYTLPVFLGGSYRVWGLTAMIMDTVLQAWLPKHYTSLVVKLNLFGQK